MATVKPLLCSHAHHRRTRVAALMHPLARRRQAQLTGNAPADSPSSQWLTSERLALSPRLQNLKSFWSDFLDLSISANSRSNSC